jgi:hypothetical protein
MKHQAPPVLIDLLMQCHIDVLSSREFIRHIDVINNPPIHSVLDHYLMDDIDSYRVDNGYMYKVCYVSS